MKEYGFTQIPISISDSRNKISITKKHDTDSGEYYFDEFFVGSNDDTIVKVAFNKYGEWIALKKNWEKIQSAINNYCIVMEIYHNKTTTKFPIEIIEIGNDVHYEYVIAKKIDNYNTKDVDSSSNYNPVTKPYHYTQGGIECIDAIKASMSDEEFKGFLKGNVMKYIWRYENKDKLQDLNKAMWYLNKLISIIE